MIVSSKGLLFNRSKTNQEFRKQFLSTFNVKTIINFSALRHDLFSEAVGPGAAVIFSPNGSENSQTIFYCSPKPSYSPQDDWLLIIEPQDIAHIPKGEAIENDIIWKVAMWGSPRDYELIKQLSRLPTLGEICEKKGWIHAEGFIISSGDYEAPKLFGKPFVEARKLQQFTMDEESLPINKVTHFYRYAKTKQEIFQGPHVLIKQSPRAGVGSIAALLKNDAIFPQTILGIHGKERDLNHLATCCLVINSKIALYYEMLISSNWLVERDVFEKEEIMNIPMPENILDLDRNISYEFLQKLSKNIEADKIVNEIINDLYDLDETEMTLINDTIEFTLDYFRRKDKSIATKPLDEESLRTYVDTFCNVLNNSFSSPKKVFAGTGFLGKSPLLVVSAHLEDKTKESVVKIYFQEHKLRDVLNKLEKTLINESPPGIYIRRNIRRYSGDTISIVKPNQMRYWTKSAALHDADETYADIMSLWGSFK